MPRTKEKTVKHFMVGGLAAMLTAGWLIASAPAAWMPSCQRMGPDQHPLGLAFYDPPTHIDD
jgi:hypothetical protein